MEFSLFRCVSKKCCKSKNYYPGFLFRRNYFLFVPPGQNPVYETPDYGIVKRTNFVKPVRKSGQKFAVHFLKFF